MAVVVVIMGVLVLVMQIRSVVMVVFHRFVTMTVGVFADHRRVVKVRVMAVVVAMRVFVFELLVSVAVLVPLGEM